MCSVIFNVSFHTRQLYCSIIAVDQTYAYRTLFPLILYFLFSFLNFQQTMLTLNCQVMADSTCVTEWGLFSSRTRAAVSISLVTRCTIQTCLTLLCTVDTVVSVLACCSHTKPEVKIEHITSCISVATFDYNVIYCVV